MKFATYTEETKFFSLSTLDYIWTKGMILPAPKLILLFIIMANCFFGASLFVGWPSILVVYKSEGYYSNLCINSNATTIANATNINTLNITSNSTVITCAAQTDRFTLIYTLSSSCYYLGYLVFGFLLDVSGPKIANMAANFFIFLGSTFLIFYQYFDSLIPGWILISLGGSGLTNSSLHIANLFTTTKSFVLGIIPTALLVSGFILTIFQFLVRAGVPLYVLFILYSTLQLSYFVFVCLFQPFSAFKLSDVKPNWREKFTKKNNETELEGIEIEQKKQIQEKFQSKNVEEESPKQIENEHEENKSETKNIDNENNIEQNELEVEENENEEKPLETVEEILGKMEEELPKKKIFTCKFTIFKQIFTIDYFLAAYFLCVHSIIYTWYTGTLFDQFLLMGDVYHDYATSFNFSLLAVFLFFPFQGLIIKFLGTSLSFAIAAMFSILLMSVISIPVIYIQPIGFALFVFGRPFLISTVLMHFNQVFGFGNIGMLNGSLTFFVGMLNFGQILFKMFVSATGNRYYIINMILIGFAIFSFSLPFYIALRKLFLKLKKISKEKTQVTEAEISK
eukprot:gene612-8116_t